MSSRPIQYDQESRRDWLRSKKQAGEWDVALSTIGAEVPKEAARLDDGSEQSGVSGDDKRFEHWSL